MHRDCRTIHEWEQGWHRVWMSDTRTGDTIITGIGGRFIGIADIWVPIYR